MVKLLNKGKEALRRAAILTTSLMYGSFRTYCGDDLFSTANSATKTLQSKIIELGKNIFPLALVITVVSLFITHDERKLAMEIKILIALCVLYALMILVDRGVIGTTIEGLL